MAWDVMELIVSWPLSASFGQFGRRHTHLIGGPDEMAR